jgi:hypothetical protein
MIRARVAIAGVTAATVAVTGAAGLAVAGETLHNSVTRSLGPGATMQYVVAYPRAPKRAPAPHAGKVLILPPAPHTHGKKPSLSRVRILGQGPCHRGSDFCARVRNANTSDTAPVRVRILTATLVSGSASPRSA